VRVRVGGLRVRMRRKMRVRMRNGATCWRLWWLARVKIRAGVKVTARVKVRVRVRVRVMVRVRAS
jgi:hypothetical protein